MVPTYFRRELRDRSLQRRPRLRTFVGFVSVHCFCCRALPLPAIPPSADPMAGLTRQPVRRPIRRLMSVSRPPGPRAMRGRSPC